MVLSTSILNGFVPVDSLVHVISQHAPMQSPLASLSSFDSRSPPPPPLLYFIMSPPAQPTGLIIQLPASWTVCFSLLKIVSTLSGIHRVYPSKPNQAKHLSLSEPGKNKHFVFCMGCNMLEHVITTIPLCWLIISSSLSTWGYAATQAVQHGTPGKHPPSFPAPVAPGRRASPGSSRSVVPIC